ncbi:hypothetical protein KAR91_78890 [Candidatus Pacearchaeota archaeon]|nr:hypothetical protein [Candidatus Pacearchaeota archaeon]
MCGQSSIPEQIFSERNRQQQLWGNDFDDKNTANDWVAYIGNYVNLAAYSGREAKYTPARFRENLIKAATLCIAAIEAVDRNGDCAPRHYEGLPGAGAKKIEGEQK